MAKKLVSYAIVVVIAFLMALNYQLFVFPNSFAPAGLNGIFTMLQHLFGFKLSYASILLNVPLAAFVYVKVNRPYAARSMIYTLAFSAFLMLLDRVDLSAFVYSTTVSTLLGPAVAGLIAGFCGYYMHKLGCGLGGTEFIAKIIHKRNPNFNFFSIIFGLNAVVAVVSYFVYDYKIEPVLLCIIYCYFSSNIRDNMNRKHLSALRCEIVTDRGEELGKCIIDTLHHSVTQIPGTGLYTGQQKSVLVCVLNPTQLNELTKLVAEFPGSFVTVSPVNTVVGNFKRLDSHSKPETPLYDPGIVNK